MTERPTNEYLDFIEVNKPERKTPIIEVWSINQGTMLGQIKWFGRWRQFAFYPEPGTIWNPGCLDTITGYIEALMAERRAVAA